MLHRCRALLATKTREEAGSALISEVEKAKKVVKRRKGGGKMRVSEGNKKENMLLLRERRAALLEQGKKIPKELKTPSELRAERDMEKLLDQGPKVMSQLTYYGTKLPEKRHKFVRGSFCTSLNSAKTDMHPAAASQWLSIVKSAPQGMLRYHLREFTPYFDDRLKEQYFHRFYDSSDIEVLKRKGYVFEGRDGEPLKLTLEEMRQVREASIYTKDDKAMQRNIRHMVNRRTQMRTKELAAAPTFRAMSYNEGDSLAYIAYRTYPIYAVMLRVYGEIILRCPQFMPRSMLDFGTGAGTAIFTAVEVWKGVPFGDAPRSTRQKTERLAYEYKDRLTLRHPRFLDAQLKEVLSDVIKKEIEVLEEKSVEVGKQVARGLLPSGSEVEVQDEVEERKKLLDASIWEGSQAWKGEVISDGLDEDFLGEGMYTGKTKAFEESDYFLEKDHSDYPIPDEAKDLEKRGIRSDVYLKWFDVKENWAGSYYAHVEKKKMERDPSYRPHSAMQYLESKAKHDQPDNELESSRLHEEDDVDNALVFNDWEKREGEVLGKITAVEPSSAMMSFGMDFLASTAPQVDWKRFLPDGAAASTKHDFVTCAYTLSEFQSETLRADAIRSLWEHCEGILVIIEAATPPGFKLVMDARTTILTEYKNIGPWEAQPTVLAPCPHDSRCPVEYSLQGRKWKEMRTCFSTARYTESFVESWVNGVTGTGEEHYSYCVIARNDIIPKKALRDVKEVEPTVVTENPAKMATDPRILKVLNDPEERKRWGDDNRRMVEDDAYPVEEELEYPETEFNLNPMQGRWRVNDLKTKDYVALNKEVQEYRQNFREKSWNWSRIVRPVHPNGTVDVCTPRGTQERFRIVPYTSDPTFKKIVRTAYPGGLVPHTNLLRRYEWVQGDTPNTFAQPVDSLNPLNTDLEAKADKKQKRVDRKEALQNEPELASWEQAMEDRLESAKANPAEMEEIRRELRGMGYHPRGSK